MKAIPILALLLSVASVEAAKKAKLNIRIEAATTSSGFVNPDCADSSNDLRKTINKGTWGRGTKWMTVRDNKPAVFTVIITGRGTTPGVDVGPSIYSRPGGTTLRVDHNRFVHYEIWIDEERVLAGNGSVYADVDIIATTWYGAANDLRKQLERFVEINYEALTEAVR